MQPAQVSATERDERSECASGRQATAMPKRHPDPLRFRNSRIGLWSSSGRHPSVQRQSLIRGNRIKPWHFAYPIEAS